MSTSTANGPIFLVGCPRSGTTLLRRLLVSHPRIAIPEESHFIPFMFDAYGDPTTEADAVRASEAILSLRWIRDWKCPFDRDLLYRCRSFADLATTIFESYARHEGKPRWGDKTPQYVACIPLLSGFFPGARFIHIHRDPRDVVRSWVASPFGPKNVYVAASEWSRLVMAGRAAGARLPKGSYMEIEYASLVGDLEQTMRRICEFVGEDFLPSVLCPTAYTGPKTIYRFWTPRAPRSSHRTAEEAVEAARAGRWRGTMAARDRGTVETVAGSAMEAFGYPTENLSRSVGGFEHVMWKLHSRLVETMVMLNSYPARDIMAMARELTRSHWRVRKRPGA